MPGLFGDEFEIVLKEKNISKLAASMKKSVLESDDDENDADVAKKLKSKKLTLKERLEIITDRVVKRLGRQRKNIVVIRDDATFHDYITKCIESGRIAIDTETNNSLDPVTCKIMGLCLYYPGGKQAYIPVNHVNPDTGIKLDNQITEETIGKELKRIVDSGIMIIMANGKFDYEVIKCTCGIAIVPDWDTVICARLLDENERAGLKFQYIKYCDPTQKKYDIEELFESIPYELVDPMIFSLYAATDALMTDKVFLRQYDIITAPEYERLYWLFKNVEMPIVEVTAEMELTGVNVDQELGARLKEKYTTKLDDLTKEIEAEITALTPKIDAWKLTSDATDRTKQYQPKKSKKTLDEIEAAYPYVDKDGKRYKLGKPKIEQLTDPINVASPTQLAILLYDVIGCKATSKKSPRGTGEEEMNALAEMYPDLKLCKMILEFRSYCKLISSYIDTIPTLAKHWPDGRIRFHLNSLGTDTGRYSSGGKIKYNENGEQITVSGINIQNIPSRNAEIRLLFKATEDTHKVEINEDYYEVPEYDQVETSNGWIRVKDLKIGDIVIGEETKDVVKGIIISGSHYLIYV